jgi:hypothetical protein
MTTAVEKVDDQTMGYKTSNISVKDREGIARP